VTAKEMFIVTRNPLDVDGGIDVDAVFANLKKAKQDAKEELEYQFSEQGETDMDVYIYKLVPVTIMHGELPDLEITERKFE